MYIIILSVSSAVLSKVRPVTKGFSTLMPYIWIQFHMKMHIFIKEYDD